MHSPEGHEIVRHSNRLLIFPATGCDRLANDASGLAWLASPSLTWHLPVRAKSKHKRVHPGPIVYTRPQMVYNIILLRNMSLC